MTEKKTMVDIAVIGTGPAGVSAALTAFARGKSFTLFGPKDLSAKISKAHEINNYPGLYGKTGAQIAQEFKKQLALLNISIEDKRVTNIYNMGGYFTLLAGQEQYEAKTVIIAAGVDFGKPLTGEKDFLGRGVSYCATCDGMLYKGKTVAVLSYADSEEKEAEFLASICKKVYYIPQYTGVKLKESAVLQIIQDTPVEIKGALKAASLVLKNQTVETDCIFILRESIAPATLLEGLQMDANHVAVDRACRTNIPGVFAAGDITGTPYQYAKAAGEGNVASLSAVNFLSKAK